MEKKRMPKLQSEIYDDRDSVRQRIEGKQNQKTDNSDQHRNKRKRIDKICAELHKKTEQILSILFRVLS